MKYTWLTLALLLVAPPARAGPWDPESGTLELLAGAIAHGFDGDAPPDGLRVVVLDTAGAEVTPEATPEALQGSGAILLGGAHRFANVHLAGLADRLGGRRVELRFWQRPLGARLRGYLVWHAGDEAEALDRLDTSSLQQMALMRLMPSGRATSDGWVEYTTGPVDFLLASRLAPNLLLFDEYESTHDVLETDPAARAAVDALEILDLGPAEVPDQACHRANQDAVCGARGVCLLGRCADHAAVDGMLFPTARQRTEYLDRRRFELDLYAGHAGLRARLDDFSATADRLAAEPDKDFWNRFRAAWLALADGHASAPLAGYSSPPNLGLCLVQGVADLVDGAPETPLVFSKNVFHPLLADVEAGDALVSVDGLDVASWRGLVPHRLRYNGDRDNAAYVESLQVMRAAAISGSVLEFARCEAEGPCAAGEETRYTIDVGEVAAAAWADEPVSWRGIATPCDGRFSRTGDNGSYGNTYLGAAEARGARVMMINATPAFFMPGFERWFERVTAFFAAPAERLILDQRLGNGGGFLAIAHLMGFLEAERSPHHFLMPWLGEDLEGDGEALARLRACAEQYEDGGQAFLWCGGARAEAAPDEHPARGVAAGARVAVLNGRDVSGNDFLSLHLARRTGPTRIFGPGPTFGAFGMIMSLSSHGVGLTGGGLQATDGAVVDGPQADLTAKLSGPGIAVDEIVLQRQSDAVQGVDTMMEAAHDWLAQ